MQYICSLKYQIMLLTAALGLLLISLILPWLIVNFFGQRSYSAFDNMQILTNSQKEEGNAGGTSFNNNKPQNDLVIADLTTVYPGSSAAFILSMLILYPISIAVMIGAIVFSAIGKKDGSKRKLVLSSRVGLVAGILAIITAVLWIYSVQSFKVQFSRDADLSGGVIGEEWKGNANFIIDRLIMMGLGQYLVIASGVIAIFSHFIGNTYHKYENHPYHTTASED
jgi:MFS family permease